MKLIAHRGNTEGVNSELENTPEYIQDALILGFDVEVDVWGVDGELWLGHDEPKYSMKEYFKGVDYLGDNRIWYHCKNLEAIIICDELGHGGTNFFWHQEDDFTLTSRGQIWTYPSKQLSRNSICVLPEKADYSVDDLKGCYGICSDVITDYILYNED